MTWTSRSAIPGTRSKSTERVYAQHRKTFAAWCADNGHSSLPATAATLAAYARELGSRNLAPTTIRVHISAITSWHEQQGLPRPDPRRANIVVVKLAELRAGKPRPRRADPLTLDQLRSAVASCDPTKVSGMRDRVLLLLGYTLMARRGVLSALDISDVGFSEHGMSVTIARDQRQPHGRHVIVPRLSDADPLCAVSAVELWIGLLASRGYASGPLLRHVLYRSRSHDERIFEHRLSGYGVALAFKRIMVRSGLDGTADLNAFSMRSGALTEAYNAGADPVGIARHGGWIDGSPTLFGHLSRIDAWQDNPIGKALGSPQTGGS